jgi:hypothetical protein
MLDGIDWVSDREWERALYQRIPVDAANDLTSYSYPHFRVPRVISIKRGHREEPLPHRRNTFG